MLVAFGKALRVSFLQSVFGYASHCKHEPTCGDYSLQMIKKHGLFKGSRLGIKRLLTCW